MSVFFMRRVYPRSDVRGEAGSQPSGRHPRTWSRGRLFGIFHMRADAGPVLLVLPRGAQGRIQYAYVFGSTSGARGLASNFGSGISSSLSLNSAALTMSTVATSGLLVSFANLRSEAACRM